MKGKKYFLYFLLALSLLGFVVLGYFTPRTHFVQLILLYSGLFGLFALQYYGIKHFQFLKLGITVAILFRVALLFHPPTLSDDFFRFVWDGKTITKYHTSPYELLPSELIELNELDKDDGIYKYLNSQEYYSVYPPTSQAVFAFSCWMVPGNLLGIILLMKFIILLFEIGTIWLLWQLLVYFKKDPYLLFLYALNPLVIIELTGNLHFEAGMIFFVLLSVWLILKQRTILASAAMALAICTKLWPLAFLPFFPRRMGLERGIVFMVLSLVFSAALFLPFWHPQLFENFFSSIKLYFQHFAFNGSFYYLARALGNTTTGIFPILTALFILILLVRDRNISRQALFNYFLLALTGYLLMATTVHPWYITPLIAFMIFTPYRFPMLWAALIPFTYITYRVTPYQEHLGFVVLEYTLLFGFMLYEFWLRDTKAWKAFIQKQALERAKVKLKRLQPLLSPQSQLLDIGTGNGALAKLLLDAGHDVEAIDIENKSLFAEVKPLLYDGTTLDVQGPMDTALIITVLHHTEAPDKVIQAALRHTPRIIIMEDVYTNPLQKWLTYFVDSIVNGQFWSHPYNNRSDAEWQTTFNQLGLEVKEVIRHRFLLFFSQATYLLEKA